MTEKPRSPAELRNMFGANLRILAQRFTSISELSRQLGINRTQFNRYLSGESFPRPDVLARICSFFEVDARVLLEPVGGIARNDAILNGPFLSEYLGTGALDVLEDSFPGGFYRFSRRSFTNEDQFLVNLVFIFRDGRHTFLRGFEAKEAMRQQGLPLNAEAREFRGYVARQEDGIAAVVSRRKSMTCSFNYLSRVASFENNFWIGYVTRTVRESPTGSRVERVVYEHLGSRCGDILAAARGVGFYAEQDLMPFHRRLLQTSDPFR